MYIAKLQEKYEKYGLDRRTIDYYSSIGLIKYEIEPGTNYRVYGKEAESVISKIIILRGAGLSSKDIKKAINDPSYFTTEKWNEHINDLKKKRDQIDEMIKNAEDMRDTHVFHFFDYVSSSDNTGEDDDIDLIVKKASIHIIARVIKYIDSPESLWELSDELSGEVGDFSNRCAAFIKSLRKKKDQGLSPDSDEVQKSVDNFVDKILELYGVGVYLLFISMKDLDPVSLGLDKDEIEEYKAFMEGMSIIANWFRETKSLEEAKKTDVFRVKYQDSILALDKKLGESTVDDLVEVIEVICSIPAETMKEFKEEYLDTGLDLYYKGIDVGVKESGGEISEEEKQELKNFGVFVKDAIKHYINNIVLKEK